LEQVFGSAREFGPDDDAVLTKVGKDLGAVVYNALPTSIITGLATGSSGPQAQTTVGKIAMYGAMLLGPGAAAKGAAGGIKVAQYSLRAAKAGFYPVMKWGTKGASQLTFLEAGEVWKFGTTMWPSLRYSKTWLQGMGLTMSKEWSGTLFESLWLERNKILNYIYQNGVLPAGNKIVR
jgi:hypothetical protein